jgi:hypothetical protein
MDMRIGKTEKTAMSGNVSFTRRLSRSSPQGQIRNGRGRTDDDAVEYGEPTAVFPCTEVAGEEYVEEEEAEDE